MIELGNGFAFIEGHTVYDIIEVYFRRIGFQF